MYISVCVCACLSVCLFSLKEDFVIVPIDKASNNVVSIVKAPNNVVT